MAVTRIGLTGGIGSGKSTVAALWVELGVTLVDTDVIAHELTQPGGLALPAIAAQLGPDMIGPDGALDRTRVRDRVFHDPVAKHQLEAILHPLIGAQARSQAQAAHGPVIFDVPLLVETGHWRKYVQRVLVVDCEEQTQIERVMRRSGWSREAVLAVIRKQASREQRRAAADAVIYNDGGATIDQLRLQVHALAERWLK